MADKKRIGGGLTPATAQVTASGDTVVIPAPAAGLAIEIFWVQAMTDPDETTNPIIVVKAQAGIEYYRSYVISHWEPFTLPEATALVVNLSHSSNVSVTIHYRTIVYARRYPQ